jgi:hypothetical protein
MGSLILKRFIRHLSFGNLLSIHLLTAAIPLSSRQRQGANPPNRASKKAASSVPLDIGNSAGFAFSHSPGPPFAFHWAPIIVLFEFASKDPADFSRG